MRMIESEEMQLKERHDNASVCCVIKASISHFDDAAFYAEILKNMKTII